MFDVSYKNWLKCQLKVLLTEFSVLYHFQFAELVSSEILILFRHRRWHLLQEHKYYSLKEHSFHQKVVFDLNVVITQNVVLTSQSSMLKIFVLCYMTLIWFLKTIYCQLFTSWLLGSTKYWYILLSQSGKMCKFLGPANLEGESVLKPGCFFGNTFTTK